MSKKNIEFSQLEKAYWRYVDESCPHEIHSRHRYTWVRQNTTFTIGGVLYERRSTKAMGVTGRLMHVIEFRGADGTVHEGEQELTSII